MPTVFTKTAQYYDKFYSFKDYPAEVEKLKRLIRPYLPPGQHSLLDVACGTGRHLEYLKDHFAVEGLDLDENLLEIARERLPGITFHQADMETFWLDRTFDVITCLFSSIGYLKTIQRVTNACRSMASHLNPGGVLVIEPWFTPDQWRPGQVHAMLVEEPELKLARMSTSLAEGTLSIIEFHYLIGTPEGTSHSVERHELGLFELAEMRVALESAGLRVSYDPDGLTGRGLWVGVKKES
jgi:ubiquinone/menaquinone biosynthesis C-methylase UbiE